MNADLTWAAQGDGPYDLPTPERRAQAAVKPTKQNANKRNSKQVR